MTIDVECPSCGEPTELHVDEAGGDFVEDCVVCCRPMDVHVVVTDGEPLVTVRRQDD